jgi:hypothetical protein
MSEPQQNQDEELREFESAANKTCIERQHAMEAAERTCLGLRIEIQELTKQRDAESSRADKAEAELKRAAQREDALRRELIGHREKAQGNYWAWQGDNDHLETLVRHCPVLIQAKDLQEIISKRDKAEAACAEKDYALSEIATHLDPIYMALEETKLQVRDSPDDKSYWDHEIKAWYSYSELVRRSVSSDCGRGYIPVESLLGETTIKKLVDSFVAWPLPDSVCSDHCACIKGYRHRTGTNLLTAEEARQMFEHVIESLRKEQTR